jgi:transcription elongation factor GreA
LMTDEKRTPLSKQALERLKDELTVLEGARQKVIDDIATARAHGDLSENAEYHAAKDQQGMQEARIRQLKQMIESAKIIEGGDTDGTIQVGKLVTIKHEGDDEPETYLLGLREEKGGSFDVLTPDSPLGRALIGHQVGETVAAEVPAGRLKVRVVEVRSL